MKAHVIGTGSVSLVLATMLAGSQAPAQLAPLQQIAPAGAGERLASQSAEAEQGGDHAKALQLANEAIKTDPREPWAYYDRGDALAAVGKVDEAVAAFQEAERRFSQNDTWGRSVAIWGQANALNQVGRCREAAPLYERYASFVEKVDNQAASLARQYAKGCATKAGAH